LSRQPPTLTLTERTPAEVRLAPEDVAYLLAAHAGQLDLGPTARPGHYRLTSRGYVGVVVCPHTRLVIRPKIPLENILHLLDPVSPWPATPDHIRPEPATEILDFLAGQLARLLEERAAAGLHRGYTERRETGRVLQGRLDVAAQLRQGGAAKDRLHSRLEDFTADVPCNQVARATAELVLRSPLVSEPVRATLTRALVGYHDVRPAALNEAAFAAAAPDRLGESYRPLLELCRLLADGLGPTEAAGGWAAPAFLLDMERVFERYLTEGLERLLTPAGVDVTAQESSVANRPVAGQADLVLRPDVTLVRDGRVFAVVDAKWKELGEPPLVPEDVYQVIAYGTSLGARRVVLVYPEESDRRWVYRLRRAPLAVHVRTLRVTGTAAECRRSLARLARALARPR
jgi:5-methylcytosine-specific restriction enzyme subunit McrC